jgi:hypothetical protein
MVGTDYLVNYGSSGDFSRFRSPASIPYQRGDRVVVRSHQGLELGVVMCRATASHAQFLTEQAAGELVRRATPEDDLAAQRLRARSHQLFQEARRLAAELELPLEILDVELLFEGDRAVVQHLRREDCDFRPLVSHLSRKHNLLIIMENLSLPAAPGQDDQGCGKPDCGRGKDGGCGTCATGGCSTGSCGQGAKKEEVTAYLAALRDKMDNRARMPLL